MSSPNLFKSKFHQLVNKTTFSKLIMLPISPKIYPIYIPIYYVFRYLQVQNKLVSIVFVPINASVTYRPFKFCGIIIFHVVILSIVQKAILAVSTAVSKSEWL